MKTVAAFRGSKPAEPTPTPRLTRAIPNPIYTPRRTGEWFRKDPAPCSSSDHFSVNSSSGRMPSRLFAVTTFCVVTTGAATFLAPESRARTSKAPPPPPGTRVRSARSGFAQWRLAQSASDKTLKIPLWRANVANEMPIGSPRAQRKDRGMLGPRSPLPDRAHKIGIDLPRTARVRTADTTILL